MIIFLILFFLCSPAWAIQTINVVTGYGYLTDKNGNITDKEKLSVGQHPLSDGYTYTEVPNQAALDAVMIYVSPEILAQAQAAQAQAQLTALRQQTLNTIADAQIASNPTAQATAGALKSQGAK